MVIDRVITKYWLLSGDPRNVKNATSRFIAAWELMQPFYSIKVQYQGLCSGLPITRIRRKWNNRLAGRTVAWN